MLITSEMKDTDSRQNKTKVVTTLHVASGLNSYLHQLTVYQNILTV